MLQRRQRKRTEPERVAAAPPPIDVQRALRLGWTIAEFFGRLRAYQPEFANRRNDPGEMPRFSYSNSDLSGAQQLEVSYRRMIELAAVLDLELPGVDQLVAPLLIEPPAPLDDGAKKAIHASLESWSRGAWVQLNVRSAALGRAMTYGGSLADTYWYMAAPGTEAFLSGRQSVEALLRRQRLTRMQERMDEIDEAFTSETCDAIRYGLKTWIYDSGKAAWACATEWRGLGIAVDAQPRRTPAQQLHFNLFRQIRAWRDLLFEARQPLDYVSPGFRRRAGFVAGAITVLLVLLLALGVGVLIFVLFGFALGAVQNSVIAARINDEFIEALSVLISLASTIAVVTVGLLSRMSAAVHSFDAWLESAIVRWRIRRQTTIPWNDPPRRSGEL